MGIYMQTHRYYYQMTQRMIVLGFLLVVFSAHRVEGQTEGIISYELRVNLWRRIPPERESLKSRMPEFMIRKAELFFRDAESMYKPTPDEESDAEFNSGNGRGRMTLRIGGADEEIYVNRDDQIRLFQQEFKGKKYLVKDSMEITPWKFGTETKEILGYSCKQAFYTDAERKMEVVAWYTDKVGAFIGPERWGSLPGVILAVDVNNGERTLVASDLSFKKLGRNDIKPPVTGTPISGKIFFSMIREEMESRRANGNEGNFIIRND